MFEMEFSTLSFHSLEHDESSCIIDDHVYSLLFHLQIKMEKEGIAPSAIAAFESTFASLVSGNTGMIPEDTIAPVPDLDRADALTVEPKTDLLQQTVVLKLNGGLGTGMGLDKAKSLLKVKGDDTFLDLTAKQVMQMRKDYGFKVKFMLMNSFSTSDDTLAFFQEKYPALAGEDGLEMLQNKVPKLRADNCEVRSISSFLYLF
jgi:UTP--glucose-1-phosphate uridylyltransferase